MNTSLEKRSKFWSRFWWWLTAILAPIGIFGGPFAIADMLAGLIEWKGWVAFAVEYWDQHVGKAFGTVFGWIAERISLPRPPELVSDYLTLGILLSSIFLRSAVLSGVQFIPHHRYAYPSNGIDRAIKAVLQVVVALGFVLAWPVALALAIGGTWSAGREAFRNGGVDWRTERKLAFAVLSLTPFGIFLALFLANLFLKDQ